MKLTTLIAATLLSISAFANSYSYHDYDGALLGITLDNACVTDTQVKTIQPQKVCTKLEPTTRYEDGQAITEWNCTKSAISHLASSRTFNRTVCNTWGREGDNDVCTEFGTVSEFMPQTIKVSVVTRHGDHDNFPGVTKNHTFPVCR